VNCQPAGEYLGEGYHLAGGVPAVASELMKASKLHEDAMTVTGQTIGKNYKDAKIKNTDVIRPYDDPLMTEAGFIVVSGNLFDSALMKTSVISDEFRAKYLSEPGNENRFEGRAIVFDGPEDYHDRINDPTLEIDDSCMLFIRGSGPVAYPGSAEVVNMLPPDALVQAGTTELPCIGDGRQSGTSASPSILNASPESAVGGGLAILQTGDRVLIDLNTRRVDVQLSDKELQERWDAYEPPVLEHQTPWQEIYRGMVGQLSTGACLEVATNYHGVAANMPRHSH
jgi:dihydroxyacid dehydratase/phosphogluconate dehydratase